jgi:methyl-accepting chemotaxis protein
MKIAAKLIIGFLVVAAIGGFLGIIGMLNMNKLASADKTLYQENTLGIKYSSSAGTFFQRLRYNALEMTILDTQEARQEVVTKIEGFVATIDELLGSYEKRINNKADREQYNVLAANWEAYKGYVSQITQAVTDGDVDRAKQIILVDSDTAAMDVKSNLESLLEYNNQTADAAAKDNTKLAFETELFMAIIIFVAVLISIILGLVISSSISRPVKRIVEAANQLALGDVDVSIENNRRDEIGNLYEAFEKMTDNIKKQALTVQKIADGDLTVEVEIRSEQDLLGKKLYEMVHNNNELLSGIATTAEQVAVGARQVSDASITLSQGTTEQASSIEELTASLEEIASQTEINAQNANQANKLAETAKNNAVQGNSQMKEMLAAMEDINEASSSISQVIKVIDDIAFQTNILALNAAVEAARAGQHGKGFAVVAEEVRNLAARSANAARETTEMIEGSIKKTEGGTRIAKDTAEALNSIVYGVEKVANLVNDIAIASNEQAMGIAQINQGIMQVSQVVQTNSATSEESASASEELSSQAVMLKEAVSRYQLKRTAGGFAGMDQISPEVLKMLRNMSRQDKG